MKLSKEEIDLLLSEFKETRVRIKKPSELEEGEWVAITILDIQYREIDDKIIFTHEYGSLDMVASAGSIRFSDDPVLTPADADRIFESILHQHTGEEEQYSLEYNLVVPRKDPKQRI